MALNIHEITNSNDDLLDLLSKLTSGGEDQSLTLFKIRVDLLKDGDRESGCLAGSGLSLSNNIMTCSLLDRYRKSAVCPRPYP
jgi:hypothetical protein